MKLSSNEIGLIGNNINFDSVSILMILEAKEKSSLVKRLLEVIKKEKGLTYNEAYAALQCVENILINDSRIVAIKK